MTRPKIYTMIFIAALLLTGAAVLLYAMDFCCIPKDDLPKLKPEARLHYDKALYYLDRIDPDLALTQLEKAAKINPELVSLNYLVMEVALQRAQVTYGQDSVKYYGVAESAINEVLKNPKIPEATRQDAEKQLKLIIAERDKLAERDARREAIGKILIKDKLKMLFPETPTPTPSPIPKPPAVQAPVVPQSPEYAQPGTPPPAYPSSPFAVQPTPVPSGASGDWAPKMLKP
jgi:tetratricopeptide (TPR) repeat protein